LRCELACWLLLSTLIWGTCAAAVEAVILRGGSEEVLKPKAQAVYQQTVQNYSEQIRLAGAKPFLYMTHAYVPPHSRAKLGLIDVIAASTIAAADIPVMPASRARTSQPVLYI
jgi:hypothetical protein